MPHPSLMKHLAMLIKEPTVPKVMNWTIARKIEMRLEVVEMKKL